MLITWILFALILCAILACGDNDVEDVAGAIVVSSPSFPHEGMIPPGFTCDGANKSPALEFSNLPDNSVSLALICDDPDAPSGDFVHWVIWNMPGNVTSIPENADRQLPEGAVLGMTHFRRNGWGGPCPPSGTHRYYFRVYALDTRLNLPSSAGKPQLLEAMKGHILSQGVLMGRYKRR